MNARFLAVGGIFAIQGVVFASTVVRLPELRAVFGLDYATLGMLLIAPALGGILIAPLTGRIAARIGGARTSGLSALGWAAAGIPIAHTAPYVWLLAGCLGVWGAMFVATDVGANTAATALERDTGRSLMSRMHGMFSVGALVGALCGGLAAQLGVHLATQFLIVAGILAWAASLLLVTAPAHTPIPAREGLLAVARSRWPLVVLALCALMAEGSIADWAAVLLTDLGSPPLLAASGFIAFSMSMIIGRLSGDLIIARIGRVAIIRAGAITAAVVGIIGFTAAALTGSAVVTIIAIALFGLGLAPVLPAAIAHAYASARPGQGELAAAAVASGGYIGVLLGPPVIGQVAQAVTLPWAMLALPTLAVAVLVMLSLSTAKVIRARPTSTLVIPAAPSPDYRPVMITAVAVVAAVLGGSLLPRSAATPPVVPALAAAPTPASLPPAVVVPPPMTTSPPPTSAAIPSVMEQIQLPAPSAGYVAITPDGRQAWVAHREARLITVVDTATSSVVATIPTSQPPRFLAFCQGRAWVSAYSTLPDGRSDDTAPHVVSVIDRSTLATVVPDIPVGRRPFASACTPDGTRLIVPSHDDARLDVLDTATATLTRSVSVAPNPHWVAVSPDGTSVWTANHESNVVTALTADLTERVQVPVGTSPHATSLSSDGKRVAVVNFDSHDVSIIDAASGRVVSSIAVGLGPQDIAWTLDRRRVLTADVESQTVSVVDTDSSKVTASLSVSMPTSIAMGANGIAYVTSLDTSTLTLIDTNGAL